MWSTQQKLEMLTNSHFLDFLFQSHKSLVGGIERTDVRDTHPPDGTTFNDHNQLLLLQMWKILLVSYCMELGTTDGDQSELKSRPF